MSKNYQIKIKYILDRISGCFLLLVLSPVFLAIAVSIKLNDGHSVFFKQERPGLNGSAFTLWKFRSMVPDADKLLGEKGSAVGVNRVTKVGKILRHLSLDELPQLFNIIKGEMSFIGPRPGLFEHYHKYTKIQKGRVKMKPGLTGLAQVNGRNQLKWSKRIEYDINYIENYSLCLDLKILFKTIKVVLLREGVVLDRNPEQVDDITKKTN